MAVLQTLAPLKMSKITAVGAPGNNTHVRKLLGRINPNLQGGRDKI